jgi:hypothetical protein
MGLLPSCDRAGPPAADGPKVDPSPPAREAANAPAPGEGTRPGRGPEKPVELQRLLDALPEEDRPRAGDDGLGRERANRWLAQHARGKWVEVRRQVKQVELQREPAGGYSAALFSAERPHVRVNGVEWGLILRGPDQYRIPLADIDEAAAGRLRELRQVEVTIRGRTHRVQFGWNPMTRLADLWVDLGDAVIEAPRP